MSSDIWNLNTLCRCCHADGYFTSLNLAHQAQDGVEYVYEVMLRETLGISISTPPLDASYSICNRCIEKLIDASNFKKQVLLCEEKFTVYCTNEQFLSAQDAIKIEVDKDDNDFHHDDCVELDAEIKEDENSEAAHNVKKEFTIEVDIENPIDEIEEDGKTEEKPIKTEIKTEYSKNKKKNPKNSVSPGDKPHDVVKVDQSFIVQVNTDKGVQFSCKTCGGCYQTKKEIKKHIHQQHSIPYKCELCSKQLKTRNSLKRHMKSHTENQFQCAHCNKGFNNEHVLRNHVNTHTKERRFLCDLCQKEFRYKQTLIKHLRLHAGTSKRLLCDLCGKSFNDRTNLNIHINTVHEKQRNFSCAICARNYSTKNHLKKHINAIHYGNGTGNSQKNHCSICDRTITCPKTFKIHMMRHDNKFMCRYCKEIFDQKSVWSEHVRTMHSGNHPCHLCTKTFYSKHSLNRHIDSHNGIKRFECDICGMKFNQNVMLKRHHLRLHNPDYTYRKFLQKTKCEICKKSFRNIDSHMESHTDRRHACEICGKTYPKTNALNRHKEVKHFGKSFDCEICNKKYLQKAKLNTHKFKVHKIKIEKDSPNNS